MNMAKGTVTLNQEIYNRIAGIAEAANTTAEQIILDCITMAFWLSDQDVYIKRDGEFTALQELADREVRNDRA